jgi:acetyl esterase/lipase
MQRTFRYADSDSQVGDLYLPPTGIRPPVVCLLHGGFWRLPYGREEMAPVAADLAARGYAVWNIEYRRIGEPGGGWPGAAEDVAAAVDHLAVLADRGTRLDLGRVAVVGHSAGGHLALCAGARGARQRRFAPSKVVPSVVCGLAAVADLHEAFLLDAGNGAVQSLLGGSPQRHPERYEQASPRCMLPLGVRQLILHGSADDALPPRLSRTYVQAARGAGDGVDHIELPGMGHMEYLDPGSRAHAHLCNWLGVMLAHRTPGT